MIPRRFDEAVKEWPDQRPKPRQDFRVLQDHDPSRDKKRDKNLARFEKTLKMARSERFELPTLRFEV
jgi:hypothetical protein